MESEFLNLFLETYSDSIKLINAINGVRLKGWSSQQLSDLNLAPLSQKQSEDWWNRQHIILRKV